jgi:hypothetical protein
MAKEIKEVRVEIIPDGTGTAYSKTYATYCLGSTDDADVKAFKKIELTLTGDDLTAAQDVFAKALADSESAEGIS